MSADTVVIEQRPGFQLLMRGVEKKRQRVAAEQQAVDPQTAAEAVSEELTKMHEANTAIIFKMARWTKASLKQRDAPYRTNNTDITFVSDDLGINQITGTTFPKSINTDPDSDDDSSENLYNPNAFTSPSDAAQALRRAGIREMRKGRVFLARSAVMSEKGDEAPLVLETNTMPPILQVVTYDR